MVEMVGLVVVAFICLFVGVFVRLFLFFCCLSFCLFVGRRRCCCSVCLLERSLTSSQPSKETIVSLRGWLDGWMDGFGWLAGGLADRSVACLLAD